MTAQVMAKCHDQRCQEAAVVRAHCKDGTIDEWCNAHWEIESKEPVDQFLFGPDFVLGKYNQVDVVRVEVLQ